jgi:hypothetical protein
MTQSFNEHCIFITDKGGIPAVGIPPLRWFESYFGLGKGEKND